MASATTIPLPATALAIPAEAIEAFCRRWNVRELSLFGSVLRPDFRLDSDIDVLVGFEPAVQPTVYDMIDMQDELCEMFGREVDLITPRSVERSRNQQRRNAILASAKVVYAK